MLFVYGLNIYQKGENYEWILGKKDEMRKSYLTIIWIIVIEGVMLLGTGCGKDPTLDNAKQFIEVIISCDTYKDTDAEGLEQTLSGYFTSEGYEAYKENQFLYDYPMMYSLQGAESSKVNNIKCTKKENDQLTFEVKYTVYAEKKSMQQTDQIMITITPEGKYSQVILLNTSDVVNFLDVKIQ